MPQIIRAIDILLSLIGIVLLAPVFLLVVGVLCIQRTPVFFRQKRTGRNMRPFTIIKFTTMNAQGQSTLITLSEKDDRVTPLGRFLRKTKIDELPQLFNIMRGDMSFVGPRPQIPYYTEKYHSEYSQALQVKPGLFSPASLKYSRENFHFDQSPDPLYLYEYVFLPDKLALDIGLARNLSLKVYFRYLVLGLLSALGYTPLILKMANSH